MPTAIAIQPAMFPAGALDIVETDNRPAMAVRKRGNATPGNPAGKMKIVAASGDNRSASTFQLDHFELRFSSPFGPVLQYRSRYDLGAKVQAQQMFKRRLKQWIQQEKSASLLLMITR